MDDNRYQGRTNAQGGGVWDRVLRQVVTPKESAAWADYQAWLTAGGQTLPAIDIEPLPLADLKAHKKTEINAFAASLRNKVINGRSSGEMASWTIKLLDAVAVLNHKQCPFADILPALRAALSLPSLPVSINDALGMVRGISETDHATKVLAQGIPALAAEIAIDAIRGKHCDLIDACADEPAVLLYDWSTGWPTV